MPNAPMNREPTAAVRLYLAAVMWCVRRGTRSITVAELDQIFEQYERDEAAEAQS